MVMVDGPRGRSTRDLFTEFGVTKHAEIDFDLDNASPAPGAVKKKCHDVRRRIEDESPACSRGPGSTDLRAKPASA